MFERDNKKFFLLHITFFTLPNHFCSSLLQFIFILTSPSDTYLKTMNDPVRIALKQPQRTISHSIGGVEVRTRISESIECSQLRFSSRAFTIMSKIYTICKRQKMIEKIQSVPRIWDQLSTNICIYQHFWQYQRRGKKKDILTNGKCFKWWTNLAIDGLLASILQD